MRGRDASRHRRLSRHQPRARHGDRAAQPPRARKPRMIWHRETDLAGLDLVVLPGGFSYGDYLRCGAMAAQSPVMRAVRDVRGARRPCARRLQRLPDPDRGRPAARRAAAQCLAALPLDGLPSAGGARRYRVHRRYQRGQVFRAPMAHGDGNYFADDATLDRLEGEGLVAFRYATPRADDAGAPTATAARATSPASSARICACSG